MSGEAEKIVCPNCEGAGKIWLQYEDEYELDSSVDESWLPCTKCDGSGEIPRSGCKAYLIEVLKFILPFLSP